MAIHNGFGCLFLLVRNALRYSILFISLSLIFPCLLFASNHKDKSILPLELRFKHVISSDEEFLGEILSLHQDKYGFIWVGGKDGLARYDGYDYQFYRHDRKDEKSISNNIVNDIAEDGKGNLWVATDGGLNYFDRSSQSFKRFTANEIDPHALNHNRVITLENENNKTLWIGGDEGVHALDMETHILRRYPSEENTQSELQLVGQYVMGIELVGQKMYLATGFGFKIWDREAKKVKVYGSPLPENMPSSIVRSVLIDSKERVWLGTELGLALFNEETETFRHYRNATDDPLGKSPSVWKVIEDSYGEIWAVTDGAGVARYDEESDRIVNYMANNRDDHSPTSTVFRTAMEDSAGDLWFGAYPAGVDSVSRYNATFRNFRNITDDNTSINANGVSSLLEDEKGNLWVGTEGGGLNYYDQKTKTYSVFNHVPGDLSTIGSTSIMQMAFDADNHLWAAHWDGGVSRLDLKTKKVSLYQMKPGSPDHIQINHVFGLLVDSNNDIWVGSMGGGLAKYNKERDVFNSFFYDEEKGHLVNNERVWSITEDEDKNLWLSTHDGLVKLDHIRNETMRYRHDPDDETSLSNPWVTETLIDAKGRMWVSTHGGGLNLFDRQTGTFTRIQKEDGLSSDLLYAILEDDNGYIWMSTNKGLSSYNPETHKIQNYTAEYGLQDNIFNLDAATKCRNGDLIFGGANGYTRFNPNLLTPNSDPPPVVFSDIIVQEQSVKIEPEGVINKNILLADKITLNHTQNVFSISYAALNYRITQDNQYAYWLEGFDEDWKYSGGKNTKSYTNLDAGKYVFRVKAANNEGVWNEEGAAIYIEVIPPPWRTWWAYMLYVLFIIAVVTWYVRSQRKVIAVQNSMMNQLQQVDKLKDEFVASTSHELRTPLFGIVGLAETLLDEVSDRLKPAENKHIEMIIASGRRLVTQVNDILDYAKIRNNALEVNIKPINVYELCSLVVPLTKPIIGDKDLDFENNIKPDLPAVLADPHRLQQILINLIANAIHHTYKGKVSLSAKVLENELQISIRDTGKGIPEDKYDELFEQFTQLDNVNSREQKGTGLGLPITKKLVELQNGRIWVESEMNVGSTFSFTLPTTKQHVNEITISENEQTRIDVLAERNKAELATYRAPGVEQQHKCANIKGQSIHNEPSSHILIVDDEKVNRMVLSAYLKHEPYTITEVGSGDAALEVLSKDNTIDLVMLDLMMPGMSGFEACEKMRSMYSTQELPILFTTAKGNIDDMEQAFAVGGSDFLNKPVDRKELCARVSLHLRHLRNYRASK